MTLYPAVAACIVIVACSVEQTDEVVGPKMSAKYGVVMWMMRSASRMYAENCALLE